MCIPCYCAYGKGIYSISVLTLTAYYLIEVNASYIYRLEINPFKLVVLLHVIQETQLFTHVYIYLQCQLKACKPKRIFSKYITIPTQTV